MALVLGDNFSYGGSKPLDARLKYNTLADMKAVADATMYDGCLAYCVAADKTYQWKSSNTVDESTGKWREFSSGGGGGSYTAGDGIDITNDVISTKQSEEGDIDEIIDVYPQAGNLVSIVNAFNRGDLYSTDEKMIGQWVDGKPLYQKTIDVDNPVSNDVILTGIDYICLRECVFCRVSNNDNQDCQQSYYVSGSDFASVHVYNSKTSNPTEARLWFATSGSVIKKIIATVIYTKTTDTAISIGSETEYSTDEKVVGTWIDGKPLYQKTYTGLKTMVGQIITLSSDVMVKKIDGMTESGVPINCFNGSATYFLFTCANNTAHTIYMNCSSAWENLDCIITLQYTKTTT